MSKKPKEPKEVQEQEPAERIGIRAILNAISTVALDNQPMFKGREQLRTWFNGITEEERKELSASLFHKADMIRKAADAVYQEFTDISDKYRA